MDTSETYIKMCEKAEEIQKPEILDGHDYICVQSVKAGYGSLLGAVTSPNVFEGIKEFIWLPRQDQLQEMVGDLSQSNVGCAVLASIFADWVSKMSDMGLFHSMEQLWLAFVMKKLHNKTWNGKDWVKVE